VNLLIVDADGYGQKFVAEIEVFKAKNIQIIIKNTIV